MDFDAINRFVLALVSVLVISILTCSGGMAEVTVDGSFGATRSLTGPNFEITADLGKQVDRNLFHSFQSFNIDSSQSATFSGPDSVANILSRVTGGQPSNIDGLLRSTIPGADFYFLNPSGVLFGPNASLDVQGSFHVSTADFIRMEDGVVFNASPGAEDSVLSTAPPEAFGFLDEDPAGISIQESIIEVPEGEGLSIVGGDIDITGGPLGFLGAPSGQINIISADSSGEVRFEGSDLELSEFEKLGNIVISNEGVIDAGGEGGGRVFIRGGQLEMDSSLVLSKTGGNQDGDGIDVGVDRTLSLMNAAILTQNVNGSSRDGDSIVANADRVELSGASFVGSFASGSGRGGNLKVTAKSILLNGEGVDGLAGFSTQFLGEGTGVSGDIIIFADDLEVRKGAAVSASTFGKGQAGNLFIEAKNILLSGDGKGSTGIRAQANEGSTGRAGNITIESNELAVLKGADVSAATFGDGDGGNLLVEVDRIVVSSEGDVSSTSISTQAGPMSIGNAGDLTITSGVMLIRDGGQISAGSLGEGKTGNLNIHANDILIKGVDIEGFPSGIFVDAGAKQDSGSLVLNAIRLTVNDSARISASTGSVANGGDITIMSNEIIINNRGQISAESQSGNLDAGQSGNISVTARNALRLFNGGRITVETAAADAGNIDLQVGTLLLLRDQGAITTSAAALDERFGGQGQGSGGNITIDPDFVVLDNGSTIQANALEGIAGAVDITTDFFFQSPDSVVEASAGPAGINGTVNINSPVVNIAESVAVLPESFFDASQQLSERCSARVGGSVSSFVAVGRGGLPIGPDDLAPAIALDGTSTAQSSSVDLHRGKNAELSHGLPQSSNSNKRYQLAEHDDLNGPSFSNGGFGCRE